MVTSPMIRTASPGPGKGWRHTISSGRPSSSPTARTSSLNRSRSGSTNSRRMSAGRPPTLWWLLMRAASRVPDSITSGYSVPCTRKRASEWSAATSSNTRMKVSPMVRRLASGSVTPARAFRNRSAASHVHQVHPEVGPEGLLHLLRLAGPQQAVVDEHAGQLIADRPVDQGGGHRRVHPAGEPAQHPLPADPPAAPRRPPAR